MATLYITEYSLSGWVQTPPVAAPPLEFIQADYSIPIAVGSGLSSAFQALTAVIQINCDSACSIAYGDDTTVAVVTAHRMAANETRFYLVRPGKYLAVIANS